MSLQQQSSYNGVLPVYIAGRTLGSGTYAKVRAAWSVYDDKMVAMKIINKEAASKEFMEKFLPREIKSLQRLNHPNILRLHRLVETSRYVYLILEMAHNGDLLDYINTCRGMPETQARFALHGIVEGIAHCHSNGIVHRDLKCENIMLTKDMDIKIGDFGFARQIDERGAGVSTPCGSFSYAAPELFSETPGKRYDAKKADVWSMGCILYAMVCGKLPFGDDSQVTKNLPKPLNFPSTLTEDCKNMIRCNMLNPDVQSRCSVSQLRVAHWMRGPTSTLTPYRNVVYTEENSLPQPSQQKSQPWIVETSSSLPGGRQWAPRRRRHLRDEQTHATFSPAAIDHRHSPVAQHIPPITPTSTHGPQLNEEHGRRNDADVERAEILPRPPNQSTNNQITHSSPLQTTTRAPGIKNSSGRRAIHQSSSRS